MERGGACQKIERLKYKPYFLVPDSGQFVVLHRRYEFAIYPVFPVRRRVKATNKVHQR